MWLLLGITVVGATLIWLCTGLISVRKRLKKQSASIEYDSKCERIIEQKIQYVREDAGSPIDAKLEKYQNEENHSWELRKDFSVEETTLALRNHGQQMEGLQYNITPAGMHYLLIHFDIPYMDEKEYKFVIRGHVQKSLSLTLADIKRRPRVTMPIVMECAGNGRTFMKPRFNQHVPWNREAVSHAVWTGCSLIDLLNEAGLTEDAVDVVFAGEDWGLVHDGETVLVRKTLHPQPMKSVRFERALNLAKDHIIHSCILAYEMNGMPLLPQHGFPLRLLVPGCYGHCSVKWLRSIEVTNKQFTGHFMKVYSYSVEEVDEKMREPVFYIRPRAVIKPPGVPHFSKRSRFIAAGPITLMGRAWVGGTTIQHAVKIEKVEISFDQGLTWNLTKIGEAASPWGWLRWEYEWDAPPGLTVISVKATDSDGNSQKMKLEDCDWNFHAMANTVVERLVVYALPKLSIGMKATLPLIEEYKR